MEGGSNRPDLRNRFGTTKFKETTEACVNDLSCEFNTVMYCNDYDYDSLGGDDLSYELNTEMMSRARNPTLIDVTAELAQAMTQIAQFNGKATPDEADDWICNLEKIFEAIECTEGQKLVFATYMLAREVEYWWRGVRRGMDTRGEVATWEDFKARFLERYFLASAKQQRKSQFLALQQGSMFVQDYKERFKYLARFYTQNMSEDWKCMRFEQGLRHHLLKALVHLKINEFPELDESGRAMRNQKGNFSKGKRHKKPYERPQQSRPGLLKCFECGENHIRRNCPKLSNVRKEVRTCFTCNKPGHISLYCPEKKSFGGTPQKSTNGGKPQAAGRVFAMSGAEAEKSGNLILDTCSLFGRNVHVLFDSGATHSFISLFCVENLGLSMFDLGCELVASTSTSGQVSTSSVCVGCPIEVAGHKSRVNLVCLTLEGLDVILGMDWLADNHVMINCGCQRVVFQKPEGIEMSTSKEVVRDLKGRAVCFMLIVKEQKKSIDELINGIPVVEEYVDVFPEEVPGLPPSREVEFAIDLMPGAGPISVAPYRMAPAELAELKKQIEDLKRVQMSALMIKELELIEKLRDMNLGVQLGKDHMWCSHLTIRSSFLEQVKSEQETDLELQRIVGLLGTDQAKDFALCQNGILRFRGRVCMPATTEL
ncbi:uncharacterized protein LOC106753030 [Vigna radiata var. radiata]|uniref:Uncharacterized protein LOC106753030 n=1 Tax=Vigna radiata var. radiata TaxID=3916 RepID=A0A1S3T958_VIGRR|nr:uncharacterized protein LOC106753030 [Vigna radiata var. radiata]